ncbi:MAG: hypothetical protein CBD16_00595 [Betaproteobacteria bacterium TMED156]|nr:MAG: hypothetical protein CBD16_00595 [Betaproteobacteria bacterium TMED156]
MIFKIFTNFCLIKSVKVVLFLFPVVIYAEMTARWEIIQVEEKSIYFIDRESITMSEDVGRIWQLQNYRDVMRLPPQSISTQMDYHCLKSKTRIFVQYHHTGVMSKGRLSVANIEGKDDWTSIKKNSKESRIFRIICEKDPIFEELKKAINKDSNNNEIKKGDSKSPSEEELASDNQNKKTTEKKIKSISKEK